MPFPKLSAVLNNCPVHSFTPELRQEIRKIAALTGSGDPYPALFFDAYTSLKTHFAMFYQLEPVENFSWADFDHLLDSYNAFDIQILLGPVLRRAMANAMTIDVDTTLILKPDDQSTEDFIASYTNLQTNGRYRTLPPDELYVFLGAQFGFNLSYHSEGNTRSFPENQSANFENRPHIHIFHSGAVDGGDSHWERTLDASDRVDFSEEENTHLHLVAALFCYDSPDLSEVCFDLLRSHVQETFKIIIKSGPSEQQMQRFLRDFHLTTAQIEKYLHNRLLLPKPKAIELLGTLTPQTQKLIARIPDLEGMQYDQGLLDLIMHYQPNSINYKQPIKANVRIEDYAIALTLLTPPVAQIQAHSYNRDRTEPWPIRANELLALHSVTNDYAEYILFDEGLSPHLFDICNKKEVARELSTEFVHLLQKAPAFEKKASVYLRERAFTTVSEEYGIWEKGQNDTEDSSLSGYSKDENRTHPNLARPFSGSSRLRTPPRPLRAMDSIGLDSPPRDETCSILDIYSDIYDFPSSRTTADNRRDDAESLHTDTDRQTNSVSLFSHTRNNVYLPGELPLETNGESLPLSRRLFPGMPGRSQHGLGMNASLLPDSSILRSSHNAQVTPTHHPMAPASLNTCFWLRAMQVFLAIGGFFAIIAVLTCPPLASALGLVSVWGVAVKDIALTAGFLAGTSGLIASSLFAVKKLVGEPAPIEKKTAPVRRF